MIGFSPAMVPQQPEIYNISAGDTSVIYAMGGFTLGNFVIVGGGTLILRCFSSDINGQVPITYMNTMPIPPEVLIQHYSMAKRIIPSINIAQTKALCLGNKYVTQVQNVAQKGDDLAVNASHSVDNFKTNLNVYPNPATDKITFKYDIATKGFVKIVLSNALGVIVAEIMQNEIHEIGSFESVLDTNNLNSGVYIASLETAQGRQTQKIVVVK